MIEIFPADKTTAEIQRLLQGGVLPRPIALVSTISTDGIKNLAPFSFFNVFGANPPIIAFSASRRGRDGTFKDTYNNLVATRECVVQAVTYEMVEQINTASKEFPPSEDEFVLSGLTPIPSKLVAPHRVKESPFQMECKLHQMINLGDGNAAGNLAICEVVLFHIAQHILDDGQINPFKYDAVARLGGDYYTRVTAGSIFELAKPVSPNPKN